MTTANKNSSFINAAVFFTYVLSVYRTIPLKSIPGVWNPFAKVVTRSTLSYSGSSVLEKSRALEEWMMVRCHCLLQESTCDSVRHVTCNQKLDTDVLGANRDKGMAAAHICRRCIRSRWAGVPFRTCGYFDYAKAINPGAQNDGQWAWEQNWINEQKSRHSRFGYMSQVRNLHKSAKFWGILLRIPVKYVLHSELHIVRAVSKRHMYHVWGTSVYRYRCMASTACPIVNCRACKTYLRTYLHKQEIPNDSQDTNRSSKEDQQFPSHQSLSQRGRVLTVCFNCVCK